MLTLVTLPGSTSTPISLTHRLNAVESRLTPRPLRVALRDIVEAVKRRGTPLLILATLVDIGQTIESCGTCLHATAWLPVEAFKNRTRLPLWPLLGTGLQPWLS